MTGKEYDWVRTKEKQNQVRQARVQGVTCSSTLCVKSKLRHCSEFSPEERENMFDTF